ncbi:MAG: hypothetical protein JO100_10635 [Pseudonocardia sp.]|nr:hypothetical protein [Pseudonocardia sp.]
MRRWPVRAVAGLIILGAIGLLWPFAEWNWWPVAAGLGVLAALYLLRLDVLLRGWAPHLAGLVTVALLLTRTGPWAWGFAAGLAVLAVGLVRLPAWRVLAVGVVLSVGFGLGYGISQYRTDAQRAAERSRANAELTANVVATSAELVLPSITNSLAAGDARTVCALLGVPAGQQFATAVGAPNCQLAVTWLAAQITNPTGYRAVNLPPNAIVKTPDSATVDGCQARWTKNGVPIGPRLGRFELRRFQADRFLIVGYSACR